MIFLRDKRYQRNVLVVWGIFIVGVLALVAATIWLAVALGGFLLDALYAEPPPPVTSTEAAWSDIPAKRPFVVPVVARSSESRGVDRIIYVEATAYCACERCCGKATSDPRYGVTAAGVKAQANRTIATDWNFLPRGTRVRIEGFGGTVFVVEDTFGAVDRPGRIDVFFASHSAALEFGRRRGVRVEILD